MNIEKLVLPNDFDLYYDRDLDRKPDPNWYDFRVSAVDDPDTAPAQSWRPQMRWCYNYFGSGADSFKYAVWHYKGNGWFEFKHEEDAIMFTLRWS